MAIPINYIANAGNAYPMKDISLVGKIYEKQNSKG
jgi:hypothetical protein